MFDVKTYKPDGGEGATIRKLSWSQMTSVQSALSQHGIKFFTKQVEDISADVCTVCHQRDGYHITGCSNWLWQPEETK